MELRRSILLITAVYVLAFFSHAWHLQKTVYGDGVFYYSWLRSIVIDRDIDFANEYAHEQVTHPKTQNGTYGNKYSIGPALLWAPAYITVHNSVRGDGWSLPYQLASGITSVLSALTGLILLVRLINTSQPVTSLIMLLVAGATNLFFYGSIDAVNSHALSFFACVVFLVLLTAAKKNWLAIGVSLAIVASVRLQDLIYILVLIPVWKQIQWRAFLSGFTVGFIPQLTAWFALYGTLANPYLIGGEAFDLLHPHILSVLFSIQNGLFLWTPIVAVGVAGLLVMKRETNQTDKMRRITYFVIFCIQLYLIASWSTWWQGASVSGRMFVSTLPLIAIGLGSVVARIYTHRLLRHVLPLLVLGMVVVNAIGIFYYLFTF